jgi:hypothetical protein
MPALVELSAARAGKLYGLVYPRDIWWVRLGFAFENLLFWLQRNSFRLYVHPTAAVETFMRAHGLRRRFYQTAGVWQVVVYAR